MAVPPAMDFHDRRRLSVGKSSSSSRITKPSSVPKKSGAPLLPSSRPPPTVVTANLSDFRRVVQQHTGAPPPSASSSPSLEHSRPSRLQRIAPPPLRPLHHRQDQQNQHLQQHQQHHSQQESGLLPQQQHHQYMQHDIHAQSNIQPLLRKIGPFSPPLYTQVANPYHNPNSNPNPFSYPSPNSLILSPNLLSPLPVLTPGDSTWANVLDVIQSPRPASNSASAFAPLLPLHSPNGDNSASRRRNEAFEWPALSANGHPHLYPSLHGHHTLQPFPSNGQALPSPSQHAHPFPAAPYPLLPLSPSTSFHPFPPSPTSTWLPPWSPSPFLPPHPFSPGLFLPSPGLFPPSPAAGAAAGLGPFNTGFSFHGANDYSLKPP